MSSSVDCSASRFKISHTQPHRYESKGRKERVTKNCQRLVHIASERNYSEPEK